MNENVTVAQVAQVARTAIAIGDAQIARLEQRLARIAERHAGDEHGACMFCGLNHPCPDYVDAAG